MGLDKTLMLGAIAGATILLGLPAGRIRRPAMRLRGLLNGVAVGILLFLLWDVLSAVWEPIDTALVGIHERGEGLGTALGFGALAVAGLTAGLLGLVAYEQWMKDAFARVPRRSRSPVRSAASAELVERPLGASAGSVDVLESDGSDSSGAVPQRWTTAQRLALLIAVGIGLHNFAEGLAIGQASATGEATLATLLVIGFALHNATEGFGIVAPLAGDTDEHGEPRRPSWGFLLAMAAIAGGPTFVGTAIGHTWTSEPLAVVFLSLAAGSILYVVVQLIGVAAKRHLADLLACGLLLGLIAGFATDAVVSAAGI